MASASVESSPNTYFGNSPGSPAIANLCSYSPSFKEGSLIGTLAASSSSNVKVMFNIPDEKTKGKVSKGVHGRRKRCMSTSEIGGGKKKRSESFVLPTKFLLGGNAFDPLNLQGLADGRQSAQVTPESSPFATPSHRKEVEVYIPANVHDPLNLNPLLEGKEEEVRVIQVGSRQRSKSDGDKEVVPELGKKSSDLSDAAIATDSASFLTPEPPAPEAKKLKLETPKTDTIMPDIVSPVIPQPGTSSGRSPPLRRKKEKPCIYGNYSRYYGYRNPNHDEDTRLRLLTREYFEGKVVLDVGCNIGHVTWSIARDLKPSHVTGIDIDQDLISIARKNMKYYVDDNVPQKLKSLYGQFKRTSGSEVGFPHNITFATTNYVLPSDDLLEVQTPDYDLILCLSVTKWIHLNWGDEGIRRLFRRAFKQLKPGGKLILEPQNWQSYKKRKKLTPKIFENFKSIKLRPYMFPDFLTKEVGFARFEIVKIPEHKSKGFQRPLYIYHKDTTMPSSELKMETKMDVDSAVDFTDGVLVTESSEISAVIPLEDKSTGDLEQTTVVSVEVIKSSDVEVMATVSTTENKEVFHIEKTFECTTNTETGINTTSEDFKVEHMSEVTEKGVLCMSKDSLTVIFK